MYDPTRDYRLHQKEYEDAIFRVMNHGLFINGPEVTQLEQKLADYVGVLYCIGVSSGTDALLVSLLALDIKSGDEVITVAHTWISTAEVIALLGAKPIFLDIEEETYNLDPNLIEKHITNHTKAILVVSLYGQMPDYNHINQIAAKYNLPVIEDGAQSFGATQNIKKSGSVTLLGCTSFFPSKPLGGYGDGGAIFTNNTDLAQKIRAITNHGGLERFRHKYIGLNARLDTLQAAILLVKFKYIDSCLEKRNEIANYYSDRLKNISEIILPTVAKYNTHVWAQYSILTKTPEMRDYIYHNMRNQGINIAIFYPSPLHRQECFEYLEYQIGDLPITDKVCDRIINLPCYAEITPAEIDYIITNLLQIVKNYNN